MNIVVDYGNTSAKVGVFEGDKLTMQYNFQKAEELKEFLENFSAVSFIISSVTKDPAEVLPWATQAKRKLILNPQLPLPVKIKYATPSTLGVDRIAGVCGAQHMFPKTNVLVIDAGTCITYDFLDRDGNFLGGGISPGLMMRFNAVHNFTARLPLVPLIEEAPLIGDSTESCIQSGVINGLIEELSGIIRLYRQKFEGLSVILSGGDARFFENKLKGSIFAVPELVLSGLNSILIHNVGR
ncbi:MAG TPA: type III pantothenate kinase [Chryseolinea sp.]|nr:type III pantothenate kinase [Chryseolinea sp.]